MVLSGAKLVEPKGSFGVSLWKDIRREAHQLKQDCKLILGDRIILDFGKINGVERTHCVLHFQLFMV